MRKLTSHKVNGLNEALTVEVFGERGPGNAYRDYSIRDDEAGRGFAVLRFQEGDPADEVNGISNEALLAIVEDRLLGFQAGDFACRENAVALTKLQESMMWLQKRTQDREARGVEGTSER